MNLAIPNDVISRKTIGDKVDMAKIVTTSKKDNLLPIL